MTNKPEAPARANRRSIKWILLTSLAGALLGAAAGFLLAGTPNYRSIGLIQIKPFLPGVFTDSTTPIPMFDAYADSQIAIIQSRRTIDMAMQNPEWKALGRGLSDKAVADFQSSLSVERNGIIVAVFFLDPDPAASRIAVKSVIRAYLNIYDDANTGDENRRADILENLKNKYQADLKRLRDAMQTDYGPEAPDSTYQFKLQELNRTESELQQLQMEFRMIQAIAKSPVSATQPSADDNNLAAMRLRESALSEEASQLKGELKDLGIRKMQIDDLKSQAATAQDCLDKTKLRLQQLTVENQMGGRLFVISEGTTDLSPEYGPRKKATLLGFLLGTSLASAIALTLRRRNVQ